MEIICDKTQCITFRVEEHNLTQHSLTLLLLIGFMSSTNSTHTEDDRWPAPATPQNPKHLLLVTVAILDMQAPGQSHRSSH